MAMSTPSALTPPSSDMPSPSAPARWSFIGSTTIASWSDCRAPEQRGFWHGETQVQSGRRAAGSPILRRVGRLSAICYGCGTWDAGSCSEVCRAEEVGRSTAGRSLPTAVAFCSVRRRGASTSGTGAQRRVVRRLPLDFAPQYLALDPEGRRLAVNNAGTPARVVILDLESGRVLADWKSQVGNANLAWSADGQLLAIGSYGQDSCVYVWNVRRGELASVLQGNSSYIVSAQIRALGLPAGDVSTARPGCGMPPLESSWQPHRDSALGFAPDDRRLAFADGDSDRRLGTCLGRRMPHASPGHARQSRREARRRRTSDRARSAPTAGCWQPATGTASDSGRPTRVGRSPTSRLALAKTSCFTPTVKP